MRCFVRTASATSGQWPGNRAAECPPPPAAANEIVQCWLEGLVLLLSPKSASLSLPLPLFVGTGGESWTAHPTNQTAVIEARTVRMCPTANGATTRVTYHLKTTPPVPPEQESARCDRKNMSCCSPRHVQNRAPVVVRVSRVRCVGMTTLEQPELITNT